MVYRLSLYCFQKSGKYFSNQGTFRFTLISALFAPLLIKSCNLLYLLVCLLSARRPNTNPEIQENDKIMMMYCVPCKMLLFPLPLTPVIKLTFVFGDHSNDPWHMKLVRTIFWITPHMELSSILGTLTRHSPLLVPGLFEAIIHRDCCVVI